MSFNGFIWQIRKKKKIRKTKHSSISWIRIFSLLIFSLHLNSVFHLYRACSPLAAEFRSRYIIRRCLLCLQYIEWCPLVGIAVRHLNREFRNLLRKEFPMVETVKIIFYRKRALRTHRIHLPLPLWPPRDPTNRVPNRWWSVNLLSAI